MRSPGSCGPSSLLTGGIRPVATPGGGCHRRVSDQCPHTPTHRRRCASRDRSKGAQAPKRLGGAHRVLASLRTPREGSVARKHQRPPPEGGRLARGLLSGACHAVGYQRDRLASRRGSRGLASLTVRVRPSISWPWSLAIAVLAAVRSGISTKPKPLERPVSRSVITRISSTTPYGSKSWRRAWSVVLNARLPT